MVKKQTPSNEVSIKDQLVEDLETIFKKAMESGKVSTALRAKEFLGRLMGLTSQPSKQAPKRTLSEWSIQEIEALIEELEAAQG